MILHYNTKLEESEYDDVLKKDKAISNTIIYLKLYFKMAMSIKHFIPKVS